MEFIMAKTNKKYLFTSFSSGLVLLIIDFITKYYANSILIFHQRTDTFIKWLTFFLTHNTGYHYIFGEIKNHKLWSLFGLFMLLILLIFLSNSLLKEKNVFHKRLYAVILMLTIGAGGNVLEILFTKKATDFFILEPFPWPSNICDQYINAIIYIVMPIMIIRLIFEKKMKKKLDTDAINENNGNK